MEYNNYYSSQSGHHTPQNQHGSQQLQQNQQQQPPLQTGGQIMHGPITSQNIRQAMPPGPPNHHQHQMQQIQHQQHHLGHHPQQMPPQQQQQQQQSHQNYHQVQANTPNMSPLSHSASPYPQQQTPQQHHSNQSPMPGPSPHQQGGGMPNQQHILNSQSPLHHAGHTMHIQQQQQQSNLPAPQQPNQMVRQPLGPPVMSHTQPGSHPHQNFFGGGNVSQPNVHHYPPAQHPPPTQQLQQHHHVHQHHSPILHNGPPITPHHPHQQGLGRSSPYYATILQTELRIIELNRRLQCRPISRNPSPLPNSPIDESLWWEKFASEFFEDDATLTIRVQDDKPVDYTIGRTLIPRFFRTHFDGGVAELSISLRNAKEVCLQPQTLTLDCDQAFIITTNILKDPVSAANQIVVVHTEGHLMIEFVSNNFDTLSIKSWKFITRGYREYVDRSLLATLSLHNSSLVKPITIQGLTKSTNAYLKMCMIMEPMQDLMFQHKKTKMDPRVCLRELLLERYNFKAGVDSRVAATKRRKRKPTAAPAIPGAGNTKKTKANINNATGNNSNLNNAVMISPPGAPTFSLASQDVMVVGEPSMMGGDPGDDNQRMMTRLDDPATSNLSNNDETNSMNASTGNDNGASNNNSNNDNDSSREPIIENHNLSPSLLQQGQQQQVPAPGPVQEQLSPDETDRLQQQQQSQPQPQSPKQHEQQSQMSVQDNVQDKQHQVHSQIEQVNMIEHSNVVQHNSIENMMQLSQQATDEPSIEPIIDQTNEADPTRGETTKHQKHQTHEPQQSQSQSPTHQLQNDSTEESTINSITETNVESNLTQGANSDTPQSEPTPDDSENNCRPRSCDLVVSRIPTSTNGTKSALTSNSSSNKQNRRRSSERKETLKEGLMRVHDFVVAVKDLKCEHPALWRINSQSLLEYYKPKSPTNKGGVLYENTYQFHGWNETIRKDYVGVDVKLTQHTRNQITVERLFLNFQNLEDDQSFFDRHFLIYLQILISTALDPKFWDSIENEPKHHDYFFTSRKIIEDIIKRFKTKLASKLSKLSESLLKNIEKYPNLIIRKFEKGEKQDQQQQQQPQCRACNINLCTQIITFENRSYDLHSYKPVKVTSELSKVDNSEAKDLQAHLCATCLEIVKLYSEIHHMGWKLFNIAKEKVKLHRVKGKPVNATLDECFKDEDWVERICSERDELWSRVDRMLT